MFKVMNLRGESEEIPSKPKEKEIKGSNKDKKSKEDSNYLRLSKSKWVEGQLPLSYDQY